MKAFKRRRKKTQRQPFEFTEEEQLVASFAQGNSEAILEVLDLYSPFLGNYRNIFEGNPVVSHREVRRFLSLFAATSESRKNLLHGKNRPHVDGIAGNIGQWLEDVLETAAMEDLLAEVRFVFLSMAKKYDPAKGKWGSLLSNYFRFNLLGRLKTWFKSSSPRFAASQQVPLDKLLDKPPPHPDVEPPENVSHPLGSAWIYGLECSAVFEGLTPFERWLLCERYVEGRSLRDLARQCGMRMGQLKERIEQIVLRLEADAKDLRLIKDPSENAP